VRQIAGALEEKVSIPMVRAELELIIEVQTDEFWQDVTASMLEDVRKRLRSLVKFIDKAKRQNIYTDFADLIGEEREIDLPGFGAGHDEERFHDKTQQFLRAHQNDPVIHKLRWNESLHKSDLDALEKILVEARAGTPDDLGKVRSGSGLGLFVREMVGLDREAAKRAFDGFLAGKNLTANQIQFVNRVIDYLTQSGWMRAAQLYESPFTDYSPRGVEGVRLGSGYSIAVGARQYSTNRRRILEMLPASSILHRLRAPDLTNWPTPSVRILLSSAVLLHLCAPSSSPTCLLPFPPLMTGSEST
jgi:type I restriction enzyme R subunit